MRPRETCDCGNLSYSTPADALRVMIELNKTAGENQLRLRGIYRCNNGYGPCHLTVLRGDLALLALAVAEVKDGDD